ncbi:hypothetical protein SAMN02910289_00581 [Lachnospiraceae bacterium RM5]|nr:hypothetical protein SAMN02910289_00581 [Lachnospiraceae bacterium RM5]
MKKIKIFSFVIIVIGLVVLFFINKNVSDVGWKRSNERNEVADSIYYIIYTKKYKEADVTEKKEMITDVLDEYKLNKKIKSYEVVVEGENPHVFYIDMEDIKKIILFYPFREDQN